MQFWNKRFFHKYFLFRYEVPGTNSGAINNPYILLRYIQFESNFGFGEDKLSGLITQHWFKGFNQIGLSLINLPLIRSLVVIRIRLTKQGIIYRCTLVNPGIR